MPKGSEAESADRKGVEAYRTVLPVSTNSRPATTFMTASVASSGTICGIDDGNGIDRADQGAGQDCRGNRRRIAVAELRQARIDGGAETHIGSERQVDATGDDIGAAYDQHDRQSNGKHTRDGRLTKHIADIADAEEIGCSQREDDQDGGESDQRSEAQCRSRNIAYRAGRRFSSGKPEGANSTSADMAMSLR